MNKRALASALSLFTLGGVSVGAYFGGQGPAAAPITAATVDIQQVFQLAPQRQRINAELKEEGQQFQAQVDALAAQVEKAKALITTKKPNTPEYTMAQFEVRDLQAKYERMGELLERELMRHEREKFVEFYQQLAAAIDVAAKRAKVDMVFRLRPTPDPGSPLDLKWAMFDSIDVWYADKRLDITKDVIRILTAEDKGVGAVEANGDSGSKPDGGE